MTIATSSNKVVCQGNGATTLFSFNFLIPVSGDELVIYTDALGNQTTLTNTQYTLTGFGVPSGGTVLYPISGSPIAPGTSLTIARILPLIQTTSISNQGAFYPNAVEAGLDYSMMAIQQISQQQAQGVFAPIVDTVTLNPLPAAAQRANQLLGFDGTGQPIAAQPSSALVSTVMQPVVSAGSIATAVAALGIPVYTGVGTTSGTANAQILAATAPGVFPLTAGSRLTFIPAFTNTGPMTITIGANPTVNVVERTTGGTLALSGGEVVANEITSGTFDGTNFVLDAISGALLNPISPPALASGSTNDYNPAGLATCSAIRLTGNAAGSTLTGLTAPTGATQIVLSNIGTSPITLLGNSASSQAVNRFLSQLAVVLYPTQSALLWYDTTATGWRIVQAQTAPPTAGARKNLKIVTTSTTAATITADELVLEDSSGNALRLSSVSVSYSTATSGAGGLDTGTITASNWYYEYVVYNPTTAAQTAIISLSATAPTMPSGYTFKARVGASYFDAGSKLRFKVQYDRRVQYVVGTNPTALPVMASGSAGSISTPTWVAVAVGAFVPTTAATIFISLVGAPGSDATGFIVAPNNSYGAYTSSSNPPPFCWYWINRYGFGNMLGSLTLETSNIYWANNGTLIMCAIGYEENL